MRAALNLGILVFSLAIASNADAFEFRMTLNPASSGSDPSEVVSASDQVIVDIYLDADPGLTEFSVALLFDDDGILLYDPVDPATTMPSYILYAPPLGRTSPIPATYLIPVESPPTYWNGVNVPGKRQVDIGFFNPTAYPAIATGSGIWIATLVFHVGGDGDGESTLELTLDANGTIVQAYGNDLTGQTTVSGAFTIRTLPEPGTLVALLCGLALVWALDGRRRRGTPARSS